VNSTQLLLLLNAVLMRIQYTAKNKDLERESTQWKKQWYGGKENVWSDAINGEKA